VIDHAKWPTWRAENLAGWEERVPIHLGPDGYDVEGLLSDPTRVTQTVQNDREALGSLVGLSVAHLQCYLGTDTLSLMRSGAAAVAGVDFSPSAIAHCRSLFARAGVTGTFVVGDVFESRALLPHRYDLVYASMGAINWIPSIRNWLAVAASLLKPRGRLHLRDVHPMAMAFDPEVDGELRLRYPYGETVDPVSLASDQTYVGDGTPLVHRTTHEWSHGIGEIIQGAIDAGFEIRGLEEHYYTEWRMWPSMVRQGPGRYVLADGPERLPLLFTLKALRP